MCGPTAQIKRIENECKELEQGIQELQKLSTELRIQNETRARNQKECWRHVETLRADLHDKKKALERLQAELDKRPTEYEDAKKLHDSCLEDIQQEIRNSKLIAGSRCILICALKH